MWLLSSLCGYCLDQSTQFWIHPKHASLTSVVDVNVASMDPYKSLS